MSIYGIPATASPYVDITLMADFINFVLGTDGVLVLTINGIVHQTWGASDCSALTPQAGFGWPGVCNINVNALPEGSAVPLQFELRDSANGNTLYSIVYTAAIQQTNYLQFVTGVTGYSSQYTDSQPAPQLATDIIGVPSGYPSSPSVPRGAGNSRGWSPSSGSAGVEWISIQYATPVYPVQVQLWEPIAPGTSTLVQFLDSSGNFDVAWSKGRDTAYNRTLFPSPNNTALTSPSSYLNLVGPTFLSSQMKVRTYLRH